MRYQLTLVFCFGLLANQAHACFIGAVDIFPKGEPILGHRADVIAKVYTLDKRGSNGGATVTQTARVIQIFKSSDARIKVGDTVSMRYQNSSCIVGANGRETIIYAKPATDSKGDLLLHLFAPMGSDPVMLPEGFTTRLRPIKSEETIPQGFAVILVGLSGEKPISSISFDHSENFKMELSMYASFPERTNTIVAFAIPLGVKQLNIYNYVSREKVNTQKIDIDHLGLYYVATLNTDQPGSFKKAPHPDQLKQFRADYADTIKHLETINFKWPTQ